ncbi:MAG: alanine racemase [Hyphomicrobiaceae bacterium]|nr:alanine racemase [Hyphomicrobiaceae bacterium]MCC0024673.1 alanine racemase [Hyphomicrobiaceae bacterium]
MTAHVGQFGGRLRIDLGAIQRNWKGLDTVSKTALTGAVVKADAYGTGLVPVSAALWQAGARFYFVANADEGIALRETLPDAHIFILNGLAPGAATFYAENRLMPVLNSLGELDHWLKLCIEAEEALPAAFQFDTGMNRLGFRLQEVSIVRSMMEQSGYLPQMVMSHMACADQPNHEKNRTQRALFQSLLAQFPDIPASLANSAATLSGRDNHFQIVRPGIALFGGRAVQGRPNPMAPAVTVEMPVMQVHEARTGETVGYGATYTLNRDSRLAVVACGYADGYIRTLSSSNGKPGAHMWFGGRQLPVLGRISMDLTVIDVTDLGQNVPLPGQFVEVFGPNSSIDDAAESGSTISYELLTSLNGRYSRVYVDENGAEFQV